MLNELCAELRNYFLRDYVNPEQYIHYGSYSVQDGAIQALPFLKEGQYYRIVGSTFNDGVHKYGGRWQPGDPPAALHDEDFVGAIWEMNIPPAVVQLAQEIKDWTVQNAETINSPYQSESFGGYSYTKAVAGTGKLSTDWQSHFDSRLKPYRRATVL